MSKPKVLDHIPEGWRLLPGAMTAPRGYKWIFNGESLFSGKRERALVPEELIDESVACEQ